ncbi:MAG: LON peptidase substrate-binding domain-containing protein [Betaproteobacteria bacterium]|jgi:Lon protease-like protein|nr:LON peptidase substrate-binding domain-containing protein [Betaproteobacteria bacterium]HMV19683.1 LON peptidase substrate-binding domain-containing protein [Rhodocyclaceae bacterium]HMW76479.1 LON peptidase substrate-binding domain-containing protein [Rhodocyclaceae bacterium]HNE42412.1 LON peptidase substrate-binding domain-containing protein [Rhodocyclaceae bacterium]HNL21718.1 LON peptidase substrate-binding domain-containing protein [Rhodocyclaceae bacterium]
MGLFSFRRAPPPPEIREVPLFPLKTVLFPGGILSIKVFEQRYLDMASACLRSDECFGICLIASGQEVGTPAEPHPVGTLARIVDCEVPQLGIMNLRVRGEERYRILDCAPDTGHLLRGRVELLRPPASTPLPETGARLLPLLQRIVDELGDERIAPPHRYDDAEWVGYRLTEILPVQNLAKQKLLELDDPLSRLEIIEKFLAQRGVLG